MSTIVVNEVKIISENLSLDRGDPSPSPLNAMPFPCSTPSKYNWQVEIIYYSNTSSLLDYNNRHMSSALELPIIGNLMVNLVT